MNSNRIMKLKIQKVIQILLAKFEELQEIRRLQMGMYTMSPRSFNAINKKIGFIQNLCRGFMHRLVYLC